MVLGGWVKPALKMPELRPSKKETQRREIGGLMMFPAWALKNPRRLGFSPGWRRARWVGLARSGCWLLLPSCPVHCSKL